MKADVPRAISHVLSPLSNVRFLIFEVQRSNPSPNWSLMSLLGFSTSQLPGFQLYSENITDAVKGKGRVKGCWFLDIPEVNPLLTPIIRLYRHCCFWMEYPFSAHACVYFPEICISPLAEKGPEDVAELLGGWNLDSGNGAQVAAGKKQRQSWGRGAGGRVE